MKRRYSFDQAQADALKDGPPPAPGTPSPEMFAWVTTHMLGWPQPKTTVHQPKTTDDNRVKP